MASPNSQLDHAWRDLLRPPNQRFICDLISHQLEQIASLATKGLVIDNQENAMSAIGDQKKDLPEFVNSINQLKFQPGKGWSDKKLSLRQVGIELRKAHWSENDQKNEAEFHARAANELGQLANSIKHCRNVQSHDNSEMDQPNLVLWLTASILRLIEICHCPEQFLAEAEAAKDSARKAMSIATDEIRQRVVDLDNDEDSSDAELEEKQSPTTPTTGTTLRMNPLAKMERRIALGFESIESQIEEQQDPLLSSARSTLEVEQQLTHLTEAFESLVEKLSDENQSHASSLTPAETQPIESAPSRKPSDDSATEPPLISESVTKDESELSEENEDDILYTTYNVLKEEEAKRLLLALRNEIKREYRERGVELKNWLNVLQAPIITEMLRHRVKNIDEWKNLPRYEEKYEANDDAWIMDQQLEKYGEEALELVQRTVPDGT